MIKQGGVETEHFEIRNFIARASVAPGTGVATAAAGPTMSAIAAFGAASTTTASGVRPLVSALRASRNFVLGEDLDERHVAARGRDVRGRHLPALGEHCQHSVKALASVRLPRKPKMPRGAGGTWPAAMKYFWPRWIRTRLHEQTYRVMILVVVATRRGEHRAVPEAIATGKRLRGTVGEQRLDDLLCPRHCDVIAAKCSGQAPASGWMAFAYCG